MRVSQRVMEILDRAEMAGPALRLVEQLDRADYTAANKVLEAAGGKWNRKAKAHIFDVDAADAIEPVLLTGEIIIAKQEFGAFYTPAPVAILACEMLGDINGKKLLEPSAGHGALARVAASRGAVVDCIEVLEESYQRLAAMPQFAIVAKGDFLQTNPRMLYDCVLMNPPFAKQADIWHVDHAAKFLRPGGRLVAIMSAAVQFRSNALTCRFRETVANLGGSIKPLPAGSFKESGTNVNTVIVSFSV